MADPLSVAGLAAGVVSLGLQVSGGITTYIDALNCRDQDIASVRQQNGSLQKILRICRTSLSQFERSHKDATKAVGDHLDLCEKDLQALESLVTELTAGDQSTVRRRDRLRNTGKKLLYPFNRPKLEQLETKLCNANATLQVALQALGLSVSYVSSEKLATIEMTSYHMSATLSGFDTRLESVEGLLGQLLARQTPLNGSQQEVTAAVAAKRLVGKPAVLRDICDAVTAEAKPRANGKLLARSQSAIQSARTPSTHRRGRFACLCSHRQRLRRKQVVFGSLVFSHETVAEEHLPGCPATQISTRTDQSSKIGLTYTGLRRLLNSAVQLTFAMPSGAGGWSLSPSFTYYPTVDAETAPTFRILTLMNDSRRFLTRSEANKRWEESFVSTAVSVIIRLLQTNKASARAVDTHNRSLAHYWADIIHINSMRGFSGEANGESEALLDLLECLLVNKTPLNEYDLSGRTPLSTMFGFSYAPLIDPLPAAAAELMVQSDAEAKLACLSETLPAVTWTMKPLLEGDIPIPCEVVIRQFLGCSAAVAEAYGCGPLSLAVLSNNAEQVEHLVRNHPATLAERNLFGHTPLHLAADKPACLRHLVRAADARLLNQRNCNDEWGLSALETALYWSSVHCRTRANNSWDRPCRKCKCAECAVILLKADCAVPMPGKLATLLRYTSARCKLKYIRHMKDRRDRLEQLALDKLPAKEIARLKLASGRVLDSFAPQVVGLLQDHGVQIPKALTVAWAESQHSPWASSSIYQALDGPDDAEIFFRLGFQDTDSWTTVDGPELGSYLPPLIPGLNYLHWLATHGAFSVQRNQSFESPRDVLARNFILWRLGKNLDHWSASWTPIPMLQGFSHAGSEPPPLNRVIAWVHQVHSAVLPAGVTDNCRCRCSPWGCTPLTFLLKGIYELESSHFRHRPRPSQEDSTAKDTGCLDESVSSDGDYSEDWDFWGKDPLPAVAAQLANYVKIFRADLEAKHHTAALRYATFTALGIPHICCSPERARDRRAWTPEGMTEFEDEHAYELDLLDELLIEFEGQVVTILQDPRQGIEGVVRFWKGTWLTRMSEVLDHLHSNDLPEDERHGAEEIGVVWNRPKPPQVRESRDNPHDKSSVEHWLYELEKIEAEWL